MKRLLDATEAAEYLSIEKKMLKRLRQRREIPYVEFGPRTILFDPADLDAFIASKRIAPDWEAGS